jgi:hypothetical protein
MKKRHGVFFGFAALMIAAIFTLAGCDTNGSSDDDPVLIETAAQFDAIRNNLSGHYILANDIDLASYSNFEPIGVFVPVSESPEDEENPNLELAFTGVLCAIKIEILDGWRASMPVVLGKINIL